MRTSARFVALRRRLLIVVWSRSSRTLLSGVARLTLLASDIAHASVAEVISPQAPPGHCRSIRISASFGAPGSRSPDCSVSWCLVVSTVCNLPRRVR